MVHHGLTLLQVSLVIPWLVFFGHKLLHPVSTEHQTLLPQQTIFSSPFCDDQDEVGVTKKISKKKTKKYKIVYLNAERTCFKA